MTKENEGNRSNKVWRCILFKCPVGKRNMPCCTYCDRKAACLSSCKNTPEKCGEALECDKPKEKPEEKREKRSYNTPVKKMIKELYLNDVSVDDITIKVMERTCYKTERTARKYVKAVIYGEIKEATGL